MKWEWTDHIKLQIEERNIATKAVEDTLNLTDQVVQGKRRRTIYQKIINNKLLRVVTEKNKLITAYYTDKIEKYISGDKQ